MKYSLNLVFCLCVIYFSMSLCDILFEIIDVSEETTAADNCPDEQARFYACRLLELDYEGAITLWNRHPSGVVDNATSLDNVRDACHGKAASRSNYTCKECPSPGAPGGKVCLQAVLLEYIYNIAMKIGYVHINEIAGACHTCESLHYQGRAVDIDPEISWTENKEILDMCVDMLGVAINETNHIHCEFHKPSDEAISTEGKA